MRSLVTGGAGFIASHLIPELLKRGEVVVLDDFSSGKRERLAGLEVALVEGDVADPAIAARAVEGVETVFHLAANPSVVASMSNPMATGHANDMGTISILDAARRASVRSCVFTSSCAVYGGGEPPCVETMAIDPMSPYAASKLAGEAYMMSAARSYGMRAVSVRLFNVFGPGQDPDGEYAAVIPKFIQRLQAGSGITIFGDGSQTRDFIHVSDVVRGLLAASQVDATPPGPINLGSGVAVSLLDLVRVLGEIAGERVEPQFAAARTGEVLHSRADIRAAQRWLGWQPRVSLADGLRGMVGSAV
ncbi:MAG: NAD-dependent epimerase/dehydratase family protein [Planctomycetes bacterium]|nr:NAD-dependent epimerase/dehydratase family protein [Planctomycetota bacterium]MCB9870654.1 NAD-dependent epimerase/dehydratase family protein [Planctomycetota bacterium]